MTLESRQTDKTKVQVELHKVIMAFIILICTHDTSLKNLAWSIFRCLANLKWLFFQVPIIAPEDNLSTPSSIPLSLRQQ